jgi:hypothetical protein
MSVGTLDFLFPSSVFFWKAMTEASDILDELFGIILLQVYSVYVSHAFRTNKTCLANEEHGVADDLDIETKGLVHPTSETQKVAERTSTCEEVNTNRAGVGFGV